MRTEFKVTKTAATTDSGTTSRVIGTIMQGSEQLYSAFGSASNADPEIAEALALADMVTTLNATIKKTPHADVQGHAKSLRDFVRSEHYSKGVKR